MTIEGEPTQVTLCHCLACQRRTGTVFAVQALYRARQVRSEGASRDYVRRTEQGDERRYSFCPECGATVFFTVPAAPDVVGVPVGALGDPSFPAPTVAVHESRRHHWVSVPESIRRL